MSSGPNTGCFSHWWPLLGAKLASKKWKTIFSKLYSLKAHAHCFTALIYLATWRAAKLGIFTHFTSTNLPRCSQSINPAAFDEHLITVVVITLLCTSATQKKMFCITPWSYKKHLNDKKFKKWIKNIQIMLLSYFLQKRRYKYWIILPDIKAQMFLLLLSCYSFCIIPPTQVFYY